MKPGLLLVALSLMPAGVSPEIYKWTDAEGQVHFGDAPNGASAQQIIIPPQPVKPQAEVEQEQQRRINIQKWIDAREKERAKKRKQQVELEQQKKSQKLKCTRLQAELRDKQREGVWYRLDDAGNRQYYSDAEMENQRKILRDIISKHCR